LSERGTAVVSGRGRQRRAGKIVVLVMRMVVVVDYTLWSLLRTSRRDRVGVVSRLSMGRSGSLSECGIVVGRIRLGMCRSGITIIPRAR
jgi:hypothetical protein